MGKEQSTSDTNKVSMLSGASLIANMSVISIFFQGNVVALRARERPSEKKNKRVRKRG